MQNKLQKKILVPLIALALVALGGSTYALSRTGVVQKVHAQEATIQALTNKKSGQQTEIKNSAGKETPESGVEKETADGPGGHQDTGTQVNHQFDGTE